MTAKQKFEHKCVVLHVAIKNFTLTSRDALQGLTPESDEVLRKLGEEGWELVSVAHYEDSPRAVLAFFKRTTV
jgi:hypothetical protein